MSFASDKLYNGYLRRNMSTIVTRVKVREIIIYLPCLTPHDRENIEAKREVCGNYDGMMLLLDCLKRRENWPEQFIEALEACEHSTIAAEIRAEYNALKGINNSSPGSPQTTVRAHVHPAPSAGHLSVPESGANGPAAAAPPAEGSAPPEPAARVSPPLENPVEPQTPQKSEAQLPVVVPPPEPPQESAQDEVTPPPSTPPPPPSPDTRATTPPPPQTEVISHQEPEENSESDPQDVSDEDEDDDDDDDDEEEEEEDDEEDDEEQCETEPLQTTTTTTTEVSPPQSPSPTPINSDVSGGSSDFTMTPQRPPVQETTPPVDRKPAAAVLQPEDTSEPPAAQVVEISPQTETAAAASPLPDAAGMDASLCDDSSVCLSKPGQLVSIHPQNQNSPTLPATSPPARLYSGNSDRLEISEAAAHLPACSGVGSTAACTPSALPCQENGVAHNHNEPEENHYESPCKSLQEQEVLENVVHVSEEPSILNLDGQSSTPQAQIFNGEAVKEITCAPPLSTNAVDTTLSVNIPSGENHLSPESAAAHISPEPNTLQLSEKKKASNTKYVLTAAGVGACALLLAWRFKH